MAASAPAPTRRGGGFDLRTILQSHSDAPSPRTSHPAVDAVFDPDRDAKLSVPYAEQGDPEMYTAGRLRDREDLKRNPGILDAIKRLSTVVPWVNGKLSKEEYLRFHDNLMSVLIPRATREQKAAVQARDWSIDAAGLDYMTYERFERAMFELADQWTTTVEPSEYLAFIQTLKYRLVRLPTK